MSGRWHTALAHALTGEDLALDEPGRPEPDRLVHDLATAGWTAERIGAHAIAAIEAGVAWPHPVPQELRSGCGAAQLAAALGAARHLLGLTTLETRPPSARRPLTPDEQRLLREVPPHHVG